VTITAPTDIAGCVLWLDASDAASFTLSGSDVTAWADKSTGGHSTAQSNNTRYPARTGTLNGLSTVAFLTGNDALDFPSAFSGEGTTAFVVAQAAGTGSRTIIGGSASGNYQLRINSSGQMQILRSQTEDGGSSTTNFGTSAYHILCVKAAQSSRTFRLDGAADGSSSGTMGSTLGTIGVIGEQQTGSFASESMNGSIAELIIYNSTLGGTDTSDVEAYLNTKWFGSPVVAKAAPNRSPRVNRALMRRSS
jgi:hypothetical protein